MVKSWEFSWDAAGRSPTTMREMRPFVVRFERTLEAEGRGLMTSTRGDCEQWIASLGSPFRRHWGWRSLRSFYAFVEEDMGEPSPMAKVKSPKVPLTEVTVASEDDVSRLLRACSPWRTATAARDAAIISTLWASGLRRSELAALRLTDVDLDTGSLIVRKSKTGKPRRAPLDQRAVQHIARWLAKRAMYPVDGGDALWVGKKGPLTPDGVRQVIERRRRQAGVNVSSHSFRRGLAARALSNGVSGASTSVLLGWSPGSIMLSRYTRMEAEQTALAEYNRAFGRRQSHDD
jgi:integrase